mgnify:CR=1 FL=1
MPLAFCIFHKEQNHMVKRILQYFRRETVLSAALVCALLSFLLTPPSVIHLQGIDTTTLLMLFSLYNIGLFAAVTAISFAVFAALYAVVSRQTAGAYYAIVSGGRDE